MITELVDLVTKEFSNLDKFCDGIRKNVEVLLGARRTLIGDVRDLNMEYAEDLKLKNESDGKKFYKHWEISYNYC